MYSRNDIRTAAANARTNGSAWIGDPQIPETLADYRSGNVNLEAVRVWYDEESKTYSIPGRDGITSVKALGRTVEKAIGSKGYPRHLVVAQDRASGRLRGAFGKRIDSGRLTKKERRRLKKSKLRAA